MVRRLMVVAAPLALLAGGWVIFYVLKEPPRVERCAYEDSPGVQTYRRGLGTCATLAALLIGALLASTARGRTTTLALAAAAWLTALYNVDNDAFTPHALGGYLLALFGGEVILLLSAIATLALPNPRIPQLVYLWTALLVFLPAATAVVAAEGTAGLCL